MKNIFLLFLGLYIVSIYGCRTDDDLMETEVLFYWNQTKCADPWNTGENQSNEQTEIAVKDYLESENVRIKNLYFDTNSPLDVYCESCGCGTGQRIIVRVSNLDIPRMEELKFYR